MHLLPPVPSVLASLLQQADAVREAAEAAPCYADLGFWADVATVVSLVLAVASLWLAVRTLRQARTVQAETERLRNQYLLTVRGDDFLADVDAYIRQLNKHLHMRPPLSNADLRALLQECSARLDSFGPKLEHGAKGRADALQSRLESVLAADEDLEPTEIERVYSELNGLSAATEDLIRNYREGI